MRIYVREEDSFSFLQEPSEARRELGWLDYVKKENRTNGWEEGKMWVNFSYFPAKKKKKEMAL